MGTKKKRNSKIPGIMPRKNYNGIDLIKFICAFLVLFIHIAPFSGNSLWVKNLNFLLQKYVCRVAVPFFMVSSGFFLFQKTDLTDPSKDVIKRYSFNNMRMLGLWTVLLFAGGKGHLWYISATIVAALALYLLFHYGVNPGWILVIVSGFYMIGLAGDSYYGLAEKLRVVPFIDFTAKTYTDFFLTTRNGIFMGMMFMLIGALFAHKRIKMTLWSAVGGFIISMILLCAEVDLLRYHNIQKDYNMYIFLIPVTIFLFGIAVKLNLKDRAVYRKLRAAGVLLYFLHLLVRKIIKYVFDIIKNAGGVDCSRYLFISTVVVTVALAFIIEHLSNKNKFNWLRWLYS